MGLKHKIPDGHRTTDDARRRQRQTTDDADTDSGGWRSCVQGQYVRCRFFPCFPETLACSEIPARAALTTPSWSAGHCAIALHSPLTTHRNEYTAAVNDDCPPAFAHSPRCFLSAASHRRAVSRLCMEGMPKCIVFGIRPLHGSADSSPRSTTTIGE